MGSSEGLYHRLRSGEFRLLDVQPGLSGSAFECTVRVVQLAENPKFHALSYTWGVGKKEIPVHCNGHVVLVTFSLSQALQRLRKANGIYTVWIDQICINQDDSDEKKQQVPLMGQIYTIAQAVDVWLGEASEEDNVNLAVYFIPNLVRAYEDSEDVDGTEEPNVIQKLGVLVIRSNSWEAVDALFSRPYFRRVWIVQEASLGKVVNVHCGPYEVDWHDLALAGRCTASSTIMNRDAHAAVELIQSLRRDIKTGRDRPLVQVLSQVYSLLCGNPLDRVYGVLGLVHETRPKSLVPDYKLSVRDLFTKTARQSIKTDQNLAVLSDVRSSKAVPDLPSWVPDWTSPSTIQQSIGIRGRLAGRPVMDFASQIGFQDGDLTLVVVGLHLGQIGRIGLTMPERSYEQNDAWLEWQSMAREYSSDEYETYPRSFWRTVIAHDSRVMRHRADELEKLYEASDSLKIRNRIPSDEHWEPPAEMSIVNSRSVRFEKLMSVTVGRRMFVTTEGRIGLGPPDSEEGDEVCILQGSITPLILRKVETSDQYRLVGESYVLGVDYAEFSTNLDAGGLVQYQIV